MQKLLDQEQNERERGGDGLWRPKTSCNMRYLQYCSKLDAGQFQYASPSITILVNFIITYSEKGGHSRSLSVLKTISPIRI